MQTIELLAVSGCLAILCKLETRSGCRFDTVSQVYPETLIRNPVVAVSDLLTLS